MLSKDTIKKMGKILGVDTAKLTEAIDSKTDMDVDIPTDITVLTKSELATRDKSKYDEGAIASEEMAVKTIKREKNLDFTGKKISDLVEHIEKSIDTDGTVTKLRKNITDLEAQKNSITEQMESLQTSYKVMDVIPEGYNGLNKAELKAIAEANGVTVKMEKGVLVPYKNGEVWKDDKLQTPLDAKLAYKTFFEVEKGMKAVATTEQTPTGKVGRGGASEPPKGGGGLKTKMSEIHKEWTEANPDKSMNGMEFQSHVMAKMKEARDAGQAIEQDI